MDNTINTKLGKLETHIIHDTEYPGITVGLTRDDKWIEFAWVEVDQSEKDPVLKVHVFETAGIDPVYNLNVTTEEITEYFNDIFGTEREEHDN